MQVVGGRFVIKRLVFLRVQVHLSSMYIQVFSKLHTLRLRMYFLCVLLNVDQPNEVWWG